MASGIPAPDYMGAAFAVPLRVSKISDEPSATAAETDCDDPESSTLLLERIRSDSHRRFADLLDNSRFS
jgi:hypothetical protein